IHGIQAWVALPEADEETDPWFAHHEGEDLPAWREAGVHGRLIAGEAYGMRAAVRTFSPLFYAHFEMDGGARGTLPDRYAERALYVATGAIEMNGARHRAGEMLVMAPGPADFVALEPSTVMALGGEPVGERFLFWNFVSSRPERLEQAKADWQAGRMKLPDGDGDEFIPLPAAPNPPANPGSGRPAHGRPTRQTAWT